MTAELHERRPDAETFRSNVLLLPDKLQRRIAGFDLEKVWEAYEIGYTEEGGCAICSRKQGAERIRVTGVDPIRQARRWCDSIPLDNVGTLFVCGCGFGHSLLELSRRHSSAGMVLVFEQDMRLFIAMLHCFELEPFIRQRKFAFLVGDFEEFEEEFAELIASILFLYCTSPAVAFSPTARADRARYVRTLRKVFETIAVNVNCYGNSHVDTLIGFHQLIDNVDVMAENPYFSSLKDQYRGVPAFIVANGPSLDKNVQELKKAKGKGLILCCESAINTLMKNGIVPDAICVLERDPEVYIHHFQDRGYPEEMTLLALSLVDSRIFASFAGPIVPIFRSKESNSKWMSMNVSDGVGLFGGTSVAHLAFEAAVFMGADPIVLVGQDLAYGPDGLTHSKQSIYSEERLKNTVAVIKSRPSEYVDGNEGGQVLTNSLWVHFRQVLEQLIRQNRDRTVVNATEGGARIEGTVRGRLADVIEACVKEELPVPLHRFAAERKREIDVRERRSRVHGLMQSLDVYASVYRALGTSAAERREETVRCLEESENGDEAALLPALRNRFKQNFDVMMRFLHNDLHAIFFQQVLMVAFYGLNQLGGKTTAGKVRRGLQIQYELFDQLHLICRSLDRNFTIAREKLAAKGYAAD